jgi:hypothetical protein
MPIDNLIFNTLTFDFHQRNPVFYFSDVENGKCRKIHKSIFPNENKSLFPKAGVNGSEFIALDRYPFSINLSINCTDKEQFNDVKKISELIDQVYQFSRMYWKSVRQQNLPVTIKYPEIVAQVAPHFDGNEIPQYGKNNLWFL